MEAARAASWRRPGRRGRPASRPPRGSARAIRAQPLISVHFWVQASIVDARRRPPLVAAVGQRGLPERDAVVEARVVDAVRGRRSPCSLYEPYPTSRYLHALGLAGASPKYSATCACTSGVSIHAIHLSMQFGCCGLGRHHPGVRPAGHALAGHDWRRPARRAASSVFTGTARSCRRRVVPLREVVDLVARTADQYLPTHGRCCLSSSTAASNCGWVSSYGSVMPSSGWCALRYSAASAM